MAESEITKITQSLAYKTRKILKKHEIDYENNSENIVNVIKKLREMHEYGVSNTTITLLYVILKKRFKY